MSILQSLGVLFLVLFFFMLMIVINVRKTTESEYSILFRILTNYIQLILVSVGMTRKFPSIKVMLSIPFRMFGGSSDTFLFYDCLFENQNMNFIFNSSEVLKVFLLFFLPFILFALIGGIWLILYNINKAFVPNLKRSLIISFITIVFLLHPLLATESIGMFDCVQIDHDIKAAAIDPNTGCFSWTHIKWITLTAVPIIIVWVISCPVIALILIYRDNHSEEVTYGSYFLLIYQGLKPNAIYWEFVNTFRKIVILLSLLFHPNMSVFISLTVSIFTARLQILVKPYKNSKHTKIEFLALMSGVSTLIGGLFYNLDMDYMFPNLIAYSTSFIVNLRFTIGWTHLLLEKFEKKSDSAR